MNPRKALLVALIVQSIVAIALLEWPRSYGGQSRSNFRESDLGARYAEHLVAGELPYRDFRAEYPPLAFVLFGLPRLFAKQVESYYRVYALQILVWNAAGLALATRWLQTQARTDPGSIGTRLLWYSAALLILCPLALLRLDLPVGMLLMLATLLWVRGQAFSSGAIAGAGVLLKLVPGLALVPASAEMLRGDRRGWRAWAGLGVVVAAGVMTCQLVTGPAWKGALTYHLERLIEVESTWAGLLLLWGQMTGQPVRTALLHASTEVVGPGSEVLSRLSGPAILAGLGVVVLAHCRSRQPDAVRTTLAAVLAYILFGKVLSPQYLIWLLPLGCLLNGPWSTSFRGLVLLAAICTTLLYPHGADHLASGDRLATAGLNLRNLLLLVAWILLLAPGFGRGRRAARETGIAR